MDRDTIVRRTLWTTAVSNLGGALLFAFPESSLGRLAGLPSPVPAVYALLLALFVLLFGGAYAWLAAQPEIDRPLLTLATVGKAGAFAVVFGCWWCGAADARSVIAITGDLGFAAVFAWWLIGPRPQETR